MPAAIREFSRALTGTNRLAGDSFAVFVVEDACAAGSDALHRHELEIIKTIYCHVISSDDLLGYLP